MREFKTTLTYGFMIVNTVLNHIKLCITINLASADIDFNMYYLKE